MSVTTGSNDAGLHAALGRTFYGPLLFLDSMELEIEVGAPGGRLLWFRWEQGRFTSEKGRPRRGMRSQDASVAYQVMAPARFLPSLVHSPQWMDNGLVSLRCGPPVSANGSVWTLDTRQRVLVAATADEPREGQLNIRLRRLHGVEVLDDWTEEIAEAVGRALVLHRAELHVVRPTVGWQAHSGSLRSLLRTLVMAHHPLGRGRAVRGQASADRLGDRIAWTTPVVEGRLGVVFRDAGTSLYLGRSAAGAVIDVVSGRVTHAVEGPNAGGQWWVVAHGSAGA